MERVPFARLEGHVHDDELLGARVGGAAPPADRSPVELLLLDVCLLDEGAHCSSSMGMDLKRRMFSVIAVSVGSRSIDEAPKKPTTPSVFAST